MGTVKGTHAKRYSSSGRQARCWLQTSLQVGREHNGESFDQLHTY